jgi:hypothetical protein
LRSVHICISPASTLPVVVIVIIMFIVIVEIAEIAQTLIVVRIPMPHKGV